MSTADEIIVRLTAQTDQLKAGMAEGAAIVKATQDEMAASYASTMNVFQQFDAIQKGSIKTAEDAAAAQLALSEAEKTGAFTSEELAAKQAILAAAMAKLPKEAAAASSGLVATLTSNSRTAYTTSALITDALTGQFSRSRREVAAFANETGLMSRALSLIISPAGAVLAALAAVGIAAGKGASEFSDFENAIALTNGAAGVSAGQMVTMANRIGALTGSYGDAQEAVTGLAASGRFAGDQLEQAATAAAEFASATGMKVSEVERFIEEMATNPKKALDDLENKYHVIDSAQADQIKSLLAVGDQAGATAAELDAFAKRGAQAMGDVATQARGLIGVFDHLKSSISGAWAALKENTFVDLGGGDAVEQLDAVNKQIATLKSAVAHGVLVAEPEVLMLEHERDLLQQQVAAVKEKEDGARQIAAAQKLAEPPAKGSYEALAQEGFGGIDLTGNLTKQLRDLEAAQKVSYDRRAEFEREYWGTVLHEAHAGTTAYVQAWNEVQAGQQRLDSQQLQESQEAARKQAEAARKAAEEAKRQHEKDAQSALRSLEEKRDATLAFSRERMRLDAEIVQAAIQWYGRDSTAYRQAERQKLADTQADAKETERAHKQAAATDAETAREIADARIAAAKQQAQTEFDEGKISAAQLLQIHNDLAHQKLAADVAYFKAKQALDAGDVNAEKRDAAQIVVAHLKASQQMSADLDKSLKDGERRWKQYSQRIAGEMQNAVNAMLFQHQTLRNSLASVGESIAETFIESVVDKPLQAFIAGEGEKLAAAIGFGASKTSAEAVQHAASTATDVADKTAAVVRASGVAGAQGIASFAAAPWPIDLGAPAFGASMAAAALGYLSMVSAAGGWERVPADGMLTQLHKDEMVLPAHIANPMRDMVRGGGAGGGTHHYHYTINAYDRRGLADFVARNGIELGKGLQRLGRNGHTL